LSGYANAAAYHLHHRHHAKRRPRTTIWKLDAPRDSGATPARSSPPHGSFETSRRAVDLTAISTTAVIKNERWVATSAPRQQKYKTRRLQWLLLPTHFLDRKLTAQRGDQRQCGAHREDNTPATTAM